MKSDLRTQFIHQLNEKSISLDNRLSIALGALLSQDFCVNGKEQIVIDWTAECLMENISYAKPLLKMLTKCLYSECLQTYNSTLDFSKLIEAVVNFDMNVTRRICKHILRCFLPILKNIGFHRYCRFDIQPACQVVLLLCELLESTADVKGLLDESSLQGDTTALSTVSKELCLFIRDIYKVTQQRSELKQRFIKSLFQLLLKTDPSLKESDDFQCLINELIIGEDTQSICEAFKPESKKKIPPHLKCLLEIIVKNEGICDITIFGSLFLDEYVKSCVKNYPNESNHLSLFYILLSVIGLELPLPYTTVKAANLTSSQQLAVLAQLVAMLQKHNIPSSSESQEGVLSQHLILVLKRLLSGEYCVSSELLNAVGNIFKLYPESVRPVFSLIMLQIVLVKKNSKVLKSYNNFMINIVRIFSDLNRLDKFFELFFKGAVMVSKEHDLSNLTSEMLLSKGTYSVLAEKLTSFTGNQIKLVIERLEKIFSKEFIEPLESTCLQDGGFCLLLKLIVNVMCYIMENTPIFATTRWTIISGSIQNICQSVQRLGVVILRGCQVKLGNKYEHLLEFLQLVKVLADVEIVVNEYIISMSGKRMLPEVKSKDKSGDVHNLSKSHGFLIPQEWIYISEIVREAIDQQLTIAWQDLLLQKWMKLGEEETLAHLVVEGVSEWLWATVARLSPCVPLKYLELYTDKLISSLSSPQQLTLFDNINHSSNRAFRVAMTFQSLNHLARSENNSLSGKLAKLVNIWAVINFETQFSNENLKEVISITAAATEAINRHSWEEVAVRLGPDVNMFYLRMFDVLSLMHTNCLAAETKRIVCLMMMGLSGDLRSEPDLLPTILDYVMGCLDDTSSVIPDSLQSDAMVRWLTQVVPLDYPHRPQLYIVALRRVLHSLATMEVCEGQLATDEDLLCATLQALEVAYKSGRLKNNDEYKNLLEKLVSMASHMFSFKKPKPKTIRLFSSVVKTDFLFFKRISPLLSVHLLMYLGILLNTVADSDVLEPHTMELVEVVLHPQAAVAADVVSQVCDTVTRELCRTDACPILCYPSTVQAFLQALPSDHYRQVLIKIQGHHHKNVSIVSELWSVVVRSQEGRDKARIRDKMLVPILTSCHQLVARDTSQFHSSLFNLLHSIVVHRSVTLSAKLLDQVLLILGEAPTESQPQFLQDCLSVLSALINVRAELVFDRIPVFLQRLRKYIKSLVLSSPAEDTENFTYNTLSSSSVNLVTRIIKTMSDHHSKHFARISPYLIADILHLLVTHPIEAVVKVELQNCVCWLLSICDHHGTQQLQNLLPVASIELFKVVSMTFNKDYKYTGKV